MITRNAILTDEERNILRLISRHPSAKHLTNSEIGQRLDISVTRVKTLLHQACLKLGAHNRNEAVFLALGRGEINLDELFSLDELAEILCSVDPKVLREIAGLVSRKPARGPILGQGDPALSAERRRAGILTNRERDVLILVSQGLTNLEIADRLCMSTSAVRTFLYRAFTKLGARKRADAVQLALKRGEISVGEISSIDELIHYLAPLGAESIQKIAQLVDEKQGIELASPDR